ncbi:hypothetical protein CLAIMM_08574 [Cladophialophora immunda]|nr:hypothetical protein CLAIMM_08574 [Cladophialophora immunda]
MAKEFDVERLWQIFDADKKGWLSLQDFQQGLQRIEHPIASSETVVESSFRSMGADGDGRLSKSHFAGSLSNAEAYLKYAFDNLSHSSDGTVTLSALCEDLERSHTDLAQEKFGSLLEKISGAHDGRALTFEEWRGLFVFSPILLKKVRDSEGSSTRILHSGYDGDIGVLHDKIKHIEYYFCGGFASATSRTVTAPLDRLKVFLIGQTNSKHGTLDQLYRGQPIEASKEAWLSLQTAWSALWKAGGVRSLWAGNGLNILKMFPEGAIKFGTYEGAKRFFTKVQGVSDPSQISRTAQFVSGGFGGVLAQIAAYPVDTLRFRVQCRMVEGGVRGQELIAQTAQKMWQSGGIRSFYCGVLWGILGQFPYSALDLTTFEYTKQWVIRRNERLGIKGKDAKPGPVATAAIGAFSGAFGASVVWPLNMLRTRLQTQGTPVHPPTYTGIVDVTRKTIRNEGLSALFRGITPNLVKVVPAVSVTYVVYEQSKQMFGLE